MLYKYCNTKGFDILENSRLKLSNIDVLNDPFELRFGVDNDSALINIMKEYEENTNIIELWMKILSEKSISYDIASPADIMEKFAKFQIDDFIRVKEKLLDYWNKKYGIICLSESMDIIQMWAHYTDNHKGIVVGLEEDEFVNDKEQIVTVCYRDKMVLFPVSGSYNTLDKYGIKCFLDVLHRKESNWSYEKEIRLFGELKKKEEDGNYYYSIKNSSIKELYLGLKSDDITKAFASCIKSQKRYEHLRIFKMTLHPSAFKLIPEEITI